MKKFVSLLLALAMVLGLAACGSSSAPAATEAPTAAATEAAMTDAERMAAEAEIRYALGLLLDRNYIVEAIAQGGQVPASSFVAMGMKNPDGSEFYQTSGDIFTIELKIGLGIVIYGLYYVEVYSFYSLFVQSFYHGKVWILQNTFLHLLR